MPLYRVTSRWDGFPGGPGYQNFYFDSIGVNIGRVKTFYQSLASLIPSAVTVTVPSSGDIVDTVTGTVTGLWTSPDGAAVPMTGNGVWAGPSGACISWYTDDVTEGRRVRGRTFLVPLVGGSTETNGTLAPATITTINNAAQALITGSGADFKIWHRPRNGAGGSAHVVQRHVVRDKVAILRSRRD